MKLRIKGDTLRLRLSRPETDAIGRGERVEECTHFPGGAQLRYALQPATVDTPCASLRDGNLEVRVPAAAAAAWAASMDVALLDADGIRDGDLELLIEKDFTCVEPRAGDDQSELFPNPKTSAA